MVGINTETDVTVVTDTNSMRRIVLGDRADKQLVGKPVGPLPRDGSIPNTGFASHPEPAIALWPMPGALVEPVEEITLERAISYPASSAPEVLATVQARDRFSQRVVGHERSITEGR